MWGSFLIKKDKVDFTGPPCLRTHTFCKTCENCQNMGFISKHRESLDNLLLTLKSHHNGDVHRAIHNLWPYFHKEHVYRSLVNLTKKDPVCQFF
jgi:alpha-glucosidase (family GH31 glycosyl hydrolase)